jgi:hypothetical protein
MIPEIFPGDGSIPQEPRLGSAQDDGLPRPGKLQSQHECHRRAQLGEASRAFPVQQ